MGDTSAIFSVVVMLIVFGAVAAGSAFALHHLARDMPRKRKLLTASLVGSFLPVSLPIIIIVLTGDVFPELFVVIASLIVVGLIGAIVICFPIALFMTNRLEGPDIPPSDIFE